MNVTQAQPQATGLRPRGVHAAWAATRILRFGVVGLVFLPFIAVQRMLPSGYGVWVLLGLFIAMRFVPRRLWTRLYGFMPDVQAMGYANGKPSRVQCSAALDEAESPTTCPKCGLSQPGSPMHPEIAYLAMTHRGVRRLVSCDGAHEMLFRELDGSPPENIHRDTYIALALFVLIFVASFIVSLSVPPRFERYTDFAIPIALLLGVCGVFATWYMTTRRLYARAIGRAEGLLRHHGPDESTSPQVHHEPS